MEKISLKNDLVFKEIFSKDGNENILKDFLNAILDIEIKVVKVIKDSTLAIENIKEKIGVLDIEVVADNNIIINIEMQMVNYKNIENRALFYASRLISGQLEQGDNYNQLKKVIEIIVLDYNFIKGKSYITSSKIVSSENEKIEIIKGVKFYFIELPKFRKQSKINIDEKKNQWLSYIDNKNEEMVKMSIAKNVAIRQADEQIKKFIAKREEQKIYEIRDKAIRDYNSNIGTAREEGI